MNEQNIDGQLPPQEPPHEQNQLQSSPKPSLNKGLIIGLAVALVVLAGIVGYLIFVRKSEPVAQQPTATAPVAQTEIPKQAVTSSAPEVKNSTRESVYNLFKGIVNWKTENPVSSIQISRCTNGVKYNPKYNVFGLTFGPGNPDTTPSMVSVVKQVKNVLANNGWKKCTPDNNSDGDYYSNIGPWFRETYIKAGKLLQLNRNFSMGTGYNISIQFEYSKIANSPTANWKTYRSEKYGFEVKYPTSLKVVGVMSENSVLGTAQVPAPGVHIGSLVFVIRQTNADRQFAQSYINGYLDVADNPTQHIKGPSVSCQRQVSSNVEITAVTCTGEGGNTYYALIKGYEYDIFVDGYSGGFNQRSSDEFGIFTSTDQINQTLDTFKFIY